MIITDRIYGKHEIVSPVFISLINSKPLQRLKGIAQYGVPDDYYHLENYSRFEHCVGVMLLLKILGATEEEQVAGLLHDVSHSAFSHVIDWVVGDGKTEDYQDEQHKRFIESSDIPQILLKYKYDVERITDYHLFGLLERDLPDLCADRVDYSLREFPADIAKKCVADLATLDNKIVFTNKDVALLFALNFLNKQINHWGGFEAVSRYRLFANVLKRALKDGVITENDFWQDDSFVIKKLKASQDNEVIRVLKILEAKSLANIPKSKMVAHKKFRFVDPLVITHGKLVHLSDVDNAFVSELKKAREENEKGIVLPFI